MADPERRRTLTAELIGEYRKEVIRQDLAWWCLSFSDRGRWRGVMVVSAFGPIDATREAAMRGEMPGEISYTRLGEDPPRAAINRLLTENEVRTYFGDTVAVPL